MTLLSGIPVGGPWIFTLFLSLLFVLFVAVFAFVFYVTKKQLNEKINALTNEKNELIARLDAINQQVNRQ